MLTIASSISTKIIFVLAVIAAAVLSKPTARHPHLQVVTRFGPGIGKPLTALFDKIHKEMPHNRPETLSPR